MLFHRVKSIAIKVHEKLLEMEMRRQTRMNFKEIFIKFKNNFGLLFFVHFNKKLIESEQ
jgi:hypothetical protein